MANKKKVQEVVEEVSKGEMLFKQYGKTVLGAAVLIVLVVLCGMGLKQCNNSKNTEASNSEDLYEAQFLFDQGQYEAALESFETVIAQYGSTTAGNLSKVYAGLCKKELGQFDEAIEFLKDYSGDNHILAPAVYAALGDCQVATETPDYKAAAANFEKAAAKSNSMEFSPAFLKKAGLAYEKAGDNSKAVKCYETIKNNWPETDIAQSIDKYIVRASK